MLGAGEEHTDLSPAFHHPSAHRPRPKATVSEARPPKADKPTRALGGGTFFTETPVKGTG